MSIRINPQPPGTSQGLRNAAEQRDKMRKTMEKLSSGQSVNRASDDAAALAVAQNMGAVLKGLEQGMDNVLDGMSLAHTADAALASSADNLSRMHELAVAAASDTLDSGQRDAIQAEYASLKSELDRNAAATEFNGMKLLDGSAGQVEIAVGGAGADGPEALVLDLSKSVDSSALGLASTVLSGIDGAGARLAMASLETARSAIGERRAEVGAVANRLEGVHRDLSVAAENTHAAQSRIMDTDYARETSNLVRQQVQAQGADAMQAHSRLVPSTVLNLLS